MISLLLLTNFNSAAAEATPPTSGTLEIDFLFPRNETYAPHALMPLVIALQKPSLALGVASIGWGIARGGNSTDPYFLYASGGVWEPGNTLFEPNLTYAVEPYFSYRAIDTLAYPEGLWTLYWTIYINNCSTPDHAVQKSGSVTFTTSKNGKAPDLEAATAPGACRNVPGYAFDISSVHQNTTVHEYENKCGVLGPYKESDANPCGASINATAASSISAAMTYTACELFLPPNVTCPQPTHASSTSKSGAAVTAPGLYMVVAAAAAALASWLW